MGIRPIVKQVGERIELAGTVSTSNKSAGGSQLHGVQDVNGLTLWTAAKHSRPKAGVDYEPVPLAS